MLMDFLCILYYTLLALHVSGASLVEYRIYNKIHVHLAGLSIEHIHITKMYGTVNIKYNTVSSWNWNILELDCNIIEGTK
jgi:hypothetical protein